ncbi:AAA family ATPase [Flavobacterium taihuense]|uniref:ATP-binding protein n=1 Tax=Flavobacterium taihuense TaxID=2857508 RepID=A0ABS6XWK0_9FLAO|nr:AAA family ATPase [Flavobacterium taihuense]MBW4361055.1 ATP-binding protein [Flavobacterium taihuense]
MAIPNNIEREHILAAISEISREGIRAGREGQRYFLVDDKGINYPLKYIISIANKYANGEELDPNPNNFNTYSAWNHLADLKFKLIDIQEDKVTKNNGFKLIRLELYNNSLVCKNSSIIYDFIDDKDDQDKIYSTVIIGSNGTGKSNLFRIIILLFKDIYDNKELNPRSYGVDGKYKLEYSIDENIYTYSNFVDIGEVKFKNTSQIYRNSELIPFEEAELPSFIVANSIMLTDKYPFIRDSDTFPFYKYLGVRNIAQAASTRSYVRKTVEFIVTQINSDVFKKGIAKTGDFLGISKSIDILFYTLNTPLFFRGELDVKQFENYFNDIQIKYKDSERIPPFKLNHYLSISKDEILLNKIISFCNNLYSKNKLEKKQDRSSARKIKYNIVDENDYINLKENYELLDHLRKLGILSAPEINLNKGDEYNLTESSSGEYHFFSSMIGLLATIKPNSLIFIDEPEISLHPNWQMKYLSFLRELFSEPEFATSHIILATHSHFLISDLRGENSKIIGLKKEGNDNVIVDLPKDINTFGWTSEEVLYRIFSLRTTRNHYFEYDITLLASLIQEKSNDKEKIIEIINKLKKHEFSKNDPLTYLINEGVKLIN